MHMILRGYTKPISCIGGLNQVFNMSHPFNSINGIAIHVALSTPNITDHKSIFASINSAQGSPHPIATIQITTVDLAIANPDFVDRRSTTSSSQPASAPNDSERIYPLRNGGNADPSGVEMSAFQKGCLRFYCGLISRSSWALLRHKSAKSVIVAPRLALDWLYWLTYYSPVDDRRCTRSDWPAVPIVQNNTALKIGSCSSYFYPVQQLQYAPM